MSEGAVLDFSVRHCLCLTFVVLLGACSATGGVSGLRAASDEVAALAAPHQNLDAVRVDPDDGCYWYLYEGPVETTLLPLRSKTGRRICTSSRVTETQKG